MTQIPKKLHYVWIGDSEKPEIFNKCLKSWQEKMPDYEIVEINKENFDLDDHIARNKFLRECYKRKLWAYIADYVRIHYLYENGGIYLDTDMEIVKNFSSLFENENIEFFTGYESDDGIGMGLFGVSAKSKFLEKMIKFYDDEIYKSPLFTLPQITKYILKNDFSFDFSKNEIRDEKNGICIYKKEYFYPFLPKEKFDESIVTENTYAIHWWHHSWKGSRPFLFLKTKHLKGIKKYIKKIGIYFQIIRDDFRKQKV
jgi:glycosyltransferase